MRRGNCVWFLLYLMLLVSCSHEAQALVEFKNVKSSQKEVQKTSTSPFFKTLEPKVSYRGAVKTFAVRVLPPDSRNYVKVRKPEVNIRMADTFRKTGSFNMPVAGQISSLFGYRSDPFRRRIRVFHAGLDIRAPTGTSIFCVAPGKVVFAGWRRGYGLTVRIDHGNGLETVYAHCSSISTRLGSSVRGGDHIGAVGRTGSTTGSHLHFEVYQGGALANPISYLKH